MSRSHYVCLGCRYDGHNITCPYCGADARYMGTKFQAPKRSNLAQWRKLALVLENRGTHAVDCLSYSEKTWCTCRGSRRLATVADVKSKYGLRRSRKKNHATPAGTRLRSSVPQGKF